MQLSVNHMAFALVLLASPAHADDELAGKGEPLKIIMPRDGGLSAPEKTS